VSILRSVRSVVTTVSDCMIEGNNASEYVKNTL